MAKNTLTILKDDTTLATFKKQAYQQAEKFSVEKIVPLYTELYKQTIKNHH
jgi:hypothetical protein